MHYLVELITCYYLGSKCTATMIHIYGCSSCGKEVKNNEEIYAKLKGKLTALEKKA